MAQPQNSTLATFCDRVQVKECYVAKLLSQLATNFSTHQAKAEGKDKKKKNELLSSGLMNQCCSKEDGKNESFPFPISLINNEIANQNKNKNAVPWFPDFKFQCKITVDQNQVQHLIAVYLENVTANVKNCYRKPSMANKVKSNMETALIWFNTSYGDIQDPVNHSPYLNSMSELMSMYIDMELKTALYCKEIDDEMICRLTSSLYVFLKHSENHILDAILGAKFILGKCHDTCSFMIEKVLKHVHYPPQNETQYVRYLLAHKVWKRVVGKHKKCKFINRMTISKLTPPPSFTENVDIIKKVLPKLPKSIRNITRFYMLGKFNLKNACEMFLKTVKRVPEQETAQARNSSLVFSEQVLDSVMWLDSANNDVDDICSNLCNYSSQSLIKDKSTLNQYTEEINIKKEARSKAEKNEIGLDSDDPDSDVSMEYTSVVGSNSCEKILHAMTCSIKVSNSEPHSNSLSVVSEGNRVAGTEITHRPESIAVNLWSNWDPVFTSSSPVESCALDSSVTNMTATAEPVRDVFNSSVEIDSEEDILAELRSRASLCYGEGDEYEYEELPLQDLLNNTLCSEDDLQDSSEHHTHQSSLQEAMSDQGKNKCSSTISSSGDLCHERLTTEAPLLRQDTVLCTHSPESCTQNNEEDSHQDFNQQFINFVACCNDSSPSPGLQGISFKRGSSASESPLPFKKRCKTQT